MENEYWIFYGAEFTDNGDEGNYTPQLFFERNDAIEYLKRIIDELKENGCVVDSDFNEEDFENRFVSCICFRDRQENWNDYYDFSVEPIKAR